MLKEIEVYNQYIRKKKIKIEINRAKKKQF